MGQIFEIIINKYISFVKKLIFWQKWIFSKFWKFNVVGLWSPLVTYFFRVKNGSKIQNFLKPYFFAKKFNITSNLDNFMIIWCSFRYFRNFKISTLWSPLWIYTIAIRTCLSYPFPTLFLPLSYPFPTLFLPKKGYNSRICLTQWCLFQPCRW